MIKSVLETTSASQSEREHLLHLFHFSKSFTATYNPLLLLLLLLLAIIWKKSRLRGPRWWRAWGMRQSPWVAVLGLGDNAAASVVVGYLALNTFYSFYRATSHPLLLGARLGLLSLTNLPLLYLLAAKNLPLLPHHLGWSYERLNYLHRWCGRVVVLTALGHFFAFQIWESRTKEEGWKFFLGRVFASRRIGTGVFALCTYILIGMTSLRQIRAKLYEFFLATHLFLLLLSLLLLSLHEPSRTGLPYTIISATIFVADRTARILRHRHVRKGRVRVLPGRMVGLEVDVSAGARSPGGAMRWTSGQHVFLSAKGVVGGGAFHESHPFTIASSPSSSSSSSCMRFLIRANAGFTHTLWKHADTEANVDVVLDGPYGHAPPLRDWAGRTVVLVAGGSGVAYTIAILEDIVDRHLQRENGQEGEGVKKVVFVWAVKDRTHVSWIEAQLVEIRRKLGVRSWREGGGEDRWLEVLVHRTSSSSSSAAAAASSSETETLPLLPDETSNPDPCSDDLERELGLELIPGRPDIPAYISTAAASAHKDERSAWGGKTSSRHGGLVVATCGPAGLVRSVRGACAGLVAEGGEVEVWVETYGW